MFLSVYNSSQIFQITLYVIAALFHIVVFGITVSKWNRLPSKFRLLALVCALLLSIGFIEALYFAVSFNSLSLCDISRKILYAFLYSGFFMFDIYQLLKITAISGSIEPSKVFFGFLLVIRFVSYVVNIYSVESAQIGVVDDQGACKTVYPYDWLVYQEHIVSITFELGLCLQFAYFVYRTKIPDIPLQTFVAKVVDFETLSFVWYFFMELIYLIIFQFPVVQQWISIVNTFYFFIPSALFLSNILLLGRKRENVSTSGKGESDARIYVVSQ